MKNEPLFLRVAKEIEARIASGHHPVGALLPTEHELAASFGVSRHTIRQAHARLRELGLVSARKRAGTRVESAQPMRAFRQSLRSLPDVFRFAQDTIFRVVATETVRLRGAAAEALGLPPGRPFLHLRGCRESPGEPLPIGWTEVWLDADFAEVAEGPRIHREAIFAQVEARFGIPVVEVRQEIEAVLAEDAVAKALQVEAGSPALRIARHYLAEGGRLVELSVTTHPAARFRYGMVLTRDATRPG